MWLMNNCASAYLDILKTVFAVPCAAGLSNKDAPHCDSSLILSAQIHPLLIFPQGFTRVFDPSMGSINVNEYCVYCLYPAIEKGIVYENT